jgi:hypothetical protein
MCCPIGMNCHSTTITTSGLICCPPDAPASQCQVSNLPPKCPSNSQECSADVGGGCCPDGTACSPNGCIEFLGSGTPPPTTSTITTTYTTATNIVAPFTISGHEQSVGVKTPTTATRTFTMVIGGASKFNMRRPDIAQSR